MSQIFQEPKGLKPMPAGFSSHHQSCRGKQRKMDEQGGNKVTGIKQIVRLKEFLSKWQNATLGPKGNNNDNNNNLGSSSKRSSNSPGGISPSISMRLRNYNIYCDSDEESCQSPEPPHGVPRGYLAVYVGPELRRFIIPTSYLSDPLFKLLLEKVEEEFGFDHTGGLTIPCEIETFKFLMQCMENHQRDQAADRHDVDSVSQVALDHVQSYSCGWSGS
ncbi:uncharacterized protein LOC107793574 isoform X1 [Nicotiana tabacum]|uniref:Uncharacterized protein LOC107793574 isoform X1 n=2 Tax=Nicotiana TaxID=4085 RepID=A0A1S4A471_TOBAC|nr:PREDICTED: uncharacterized protein LOC104239193 isoform X1 [Nicotiana sylvestris]XP_016471438.1 PREDICTED: uncharacterized protein LOC107793574 isoform X1 [Nicotiana tabacum]